MQQSFVTTAPMGNSRDIDFSLCKAWVYALFYSQSPAQIQASKSEITPASLGMEIRHAVPQHWGVDAKVKT